MYKLFVAFRYLWRNWLNWVGVVAVMLAVMVPLVVLSVMTGFAEEMKSRLRDTLSDLSIQSWDQEAFAGYEELIEKIEKIPHVTGVAPEYSGLALARIGKLSRYAQFRGIDLAREAKTTDFVKYCRVWRGRRARELLATLMVGGEVSLDSYNAERITGLISELREEDFEIFASDQRKEVRRFAKSAGVDLADCFAAAETWQPEWGPVEKKREYPAFTGAEMAVIGRLPDGSLHRMAKGDLLTLIIPTGLTDEKRTFLQLRTSGHFQSGLYDYDNMTVIVPLEAVQSRLEKPGHVTKINIRLDDFKNAPDVRIALWGILTPDEILRGLNLLMPILKDEDRTLPGNIRSKVAYLKKHQDQWLEAGNVDLLKTTVEIQRELSRAIQNAIDAGTAGGATEEQVKALEAFRAFTMERGESGIGMQLQVRTWMDERVTILRAVKVERAILAVVLFFVTVLSGFLILSLLHTSVLVKRKDIGILKAIGGSVRGIMGIFLLNGTLISVVGAVLGSISGMLICAYLNEIEGVLTNLIGFELFPKSIYYLDKIPVNENPLPSALIISASAVIVSFLASALPAWKAARMDAVEALRYE